MKQGWEIKKLGEVVSVKSGKSIDANQINNETALYPCYGGNGIRGFVNDFNYEGCYPLIGRVGALCGNVHLAKGKFYATEHALIVDIKSNKINPEWLTYYLSSLNLRKIAKGVAQPVIAAKEVSKVSIHIPPLPEQEKIVSELDCLSGLIDKKRQQLKELDALAQSIFYEMFGNPVENERGWEVVQLSSAVDEKCPISYGIVQPMDDIQDGVPIVRPVDLIETFVYNRGLKKTSREISDSYKRTILRGDEILMCVRGTTGIVSLATEELRGCNTTRGIVPLFFTKMNRWFMFHLFKSDAMVNLIAEHTYGIALKQINIKDLRQLPIVIPPLPLQQTFAQKVEAIEKQKELIKQSIIEAETLLASRMQYYFEEG